MNIASRLSITSRASCAREYAGSTDQPSDAHDHSAQTASGARIDAPASGMRVAGSRHTRANTTTAHTAAPPNATDTANVAALVGRRNR
jgi:hypothetical protein